VLRNGIRPSILPVLAFERRVVEALTCSADPTRRAAVASFVDASLLAMPEHLRAGVAAESVALGNWCRVRSRHGGDPEQLRQQLRTWEHHRVDFVRKYVRMMESLVVFAEFELAESMPDEPDGPPRDLSRDPLLEHRRTS
jgi:hypothetical protein